MNCDCNRGYSLVDYLNNPSSATIQCINGQLKPIVNCAKIVDDSPSQPIDKPVKPKPTYAPTVAPTNPPTTVWTGQFPPGTNYLKKLFSTLTLKVLIILRFFD